MFSSVYDTEGNFYASMLSYFVSYVKLCRIFNIFDSKKLDCLGTNGMNIITTWVKYNAYKKYW